MTASLAGRSAARRFEIRQNHDMNVTPFVDVLLVLLIVFIIAAPLATTAIKVDIAAGSGGAAARAPVNVILDDRGAIRVESGAAPIPSSLDKLAADLAKAGAPDPSRDWVVITGAPHTRYGAFMAVMDRLHGDGFTNVTLAAKAA